MGNAIDKTFRSLSPTVSVAIDSIEEAVTGRSYERSQQKKISDLQDRNKDLQSTVTTQSNTITTYETGHKNMETAQKKAKDSIKKKQKEFQPKLDAFKNKYTSSEQDQKEDASVPNVQEMDDMNDEIDAMLQETKSATAKAEEYIKFTKDVKQQVSAVDTSEDEKAAKEHIAQLKQAQQTAMDHRKTAVAKQEIILTKQNDLSQKKINIQNQQMNVRNAEAEINRDSTKMDELRLELNQVTGAEMNADLETFNKMKNNFDELCKLLKSKHADNKERLVQLEQLEERVGTMQAKLIKQDSDNKYLIKLIDEEYKSLGQAADDVMKKFEERGTYFLAVTLSLTKEVIKKIEDIIGEEHDMEMILEIEEEDLIEAGIDKRLMRKKMLGAIKKIKDNQS